MDKRSFMSNLITALRKERQDALADLIESGRPFNQWSTKSQMEWDKAVFGAAFTVGGKRVDPTAVTIETSREQTQREYDAAVQFVQRERVDDIDD